MIWVDCLKKIKYLFFIINSYSQQEFSRVKNAYIQLSSTKHQSDLISFNLSGEGCYTSMLLGKLYLHQDSHCTMSKWTFKAIGYGSQGRTYKDNLKEMKRELIGSLKFGNHALYKFQLPKKLVTSYNENGDKKYMYVMMILVIILCLFLFMYETPIYRVY